VCPPRCVVSKYTTVRTINEHNKYGILLQIKGKAVPLQAWSGPEGSRKLRFPDFLTTAEDGGKVVSRTHWPPLPQEILLVSISAGG
jgi:hypothetical protein